MNLGQQDGPQPDRASGLHLRLSKRLLAAVFVLWLAPWVVLTYAIGVLRSATPVSHSMTAGHSPVSDAADAKAPDPSPAEPNASPVTAPYSKSPSVSPPGDGLPEARVRSNPGPWGQLDLVRIATEVPEEFVTSRMLEESSERWAFPGYSSQRLHQLLATTDLTVAQQEQLLQAAQPDSSIDGLTLTPPSELVLALSPEARGAIYSALSLFPQNLLQFDPFRYRMDRIDEWLQDDAVPPKAIELTKKLLYFRGQTAIFSDLSLVMPLLATGHEKIRYVKMLSQESALLAKLKVTPDSNVADLVRYWGGGGMSKDIEPLLESLTRVRGGCLIDVVHLLPSFARKRLYCYPREANSPDVRYDCHWTSMNFWNDRPESRFLDIDEVRRTLETDYVQVQRPYRFGDIVVVMTDDHHAIHSAVYIADEIMFTKNGPTAMSPWELMKLPHILAYYRASGPVELRAYRLKRIAEKLGS